MTTVFFQLKSGNTTISKWAQSLSIFQWFKFYYHSILTTKWRWNRKLIRQKMKKIIDKVNTHMAYLNHDLSRPWYAELTNPWCLKFKLSKGTQFNDCDEKNCVLGAIFCFSGVLGVSYGVFRALLSCFVGLSAKISKIVGKRKGWNV